jgi:fibronectin type 3 domain-containing protein
MVMGVPKKSRGAVPSARMEVPLLQAPSPPRPGTSSADETSVTITGEPPPSSTDEVSGLLYNVYALPAAGAAAPPADGGANRPSAPKPLNAAPLQDTAFSKPGAEAGKEQCFAVRSVGVVGTAFQIESDPSAPMCVTPKDTFPPAAPKGLAAVASTAVVNLIWDANAEADLAGYVVLRGDAGGATLQPLTAEPIKETRYTDRTARPGVRYAYQIVAVDKAGNRSTPSARVEEAAR